MIPKIKSVFVVLFLLGFQIIFSQQIKNEPQKPYQIGKPSRVDKVSSIASRKSRLVRPDLKKIIEMKDGRSSRYNVVVGKGSTGDDALAKNKHRLTSKIPTKTPELVFETGASGSQPTDPSGAVGPNHYISVINTAFQIFDKNGNSLTGGLVSPSTIFTFPSGGCCDLTASYDNNADRWVLSFLSSEGEGTQIAVSDGSDPLNDGWTVYTYSVVSDYQKLSVWRDGYYMTENTANANKLHVFERAAMIDAANEGTTPQILSFSLPGLITDGFHSPQVLNISSGNWPTSGGATVVYMQDDAWAGVLEDHIKLWNVTLDWETPENSQVSAAIELSAADGVTSFVSVFDGGSFSNLEQPDEGTLIDALQATIMNQAQFRKFPTYNSAVFNFVVDVDGTETNQAGVRWYELRQAGDGQPWTVYQEGTYTAPDNRHAWNASLIMDSQGNIGMGYTGMSSANSSNPNIRVGSYYTGRFSNDPLGVMTVSEEVILAGTENIPGTRYGDYSKIDVDPSNDKKFWFVNEVMSGGRKNVCGVFQLAPNFNNDIGVISIDTPASGPLTSNEPITVTIRNFGESPASGFDVAYQVNGENLITETYTETIASQTSVQYTFTATADLSIEGQTYTITSSTNLTNDEDMTNDGVTEEITHIYTNDLGVTMVTQPVSGDNLTNSVTVEIRNFGTASQSNFDVFYTVNEGTLVEETVTVPLLPQTTMSYTFNTLGDFSSDGIYSLVAGTMLVNDSDTNNNSTQVEIVNLPCNTSTNNTQTPIGPNSGTVTESVINIPDNVLISDVNVTLNIEHTYNGDLEVRLLAPDGITEVVLFSRVGGSGENFTNTVLDDDASTNIDFVNAPFTGVFRPQGALSDFIGLQSIGNWRLSITDNADADGGTLLNWSIQLCSDASLSVPDNNDLMKDFTILNKGNNQFEISLTTNSIQENLDLKIYNMLGQTLLWKTLKNESGTYSYNLDMSYAPAGIYIVRLGENQYSVMGRLVVE